MVIIYLSSAYIAPLPRPLSLPLSLSLFLFFFLSFSPIPTPSDGNPPWQETAPRTLNFTAIAIALEPLVFASARGFTTFAWMSHYWSPTYDQHIGMVAWMFCWVLLCLTTTSSQVLDVLFTEITRLPVFPLGSLLAANTWFAVLFLAELVWILLNSALVAVIFFVVVVVTAIWMLSADQIEKEAEDQVRNNLERCHLRRNQSAEQQAL